MIRTCLNFNKKNISILILNFALFSPDNGGARERVNL